VTMNLKPYPAYKDSGVPWLGQVPEHWQVLRLKRVAQLNPSRAEARDALDSGAQVTFLPMERVGADGRVDARDMRPIASVWHGFTYFRRGDILLAKITPCFENGKGAWLASLPTRVGFGSTEFTVLRAGPQIRASYLYRVTTIPEFRRLGADAMVGAAGQQRLPAAFVANFLIPVPDLDEQSAITRFLDHADRRIRRYIRAKRQLIALLNEQKQAIIERAVTRGLDPHVRLKPSGVAWLGDVPEHWEFLPLKSLARIQSGVTLGKEYPSRQLVELPYLRVANVQDGRLDLSDIKTVLVPEEEAARSTLQVGDVLMTEGGDPDKLGRGCVWDGQISRCLHQNHIFAVRPRPDRLLPRFLAALLASQYAKTYFLRTGKQTTNLASTNKATIGRFPVLLPSLREQAELLEAIRVETEHVDRAIAATEAELARIRQYRTRLISDVVTGKLHVREAAARLPEETCQEEEAAEVEDVETDDAVEPDEDAEMDG